MAALVPANAKVRAATYKWIREMLTHGLEEGAEAHGCLFAMCDCLSILSAKNERGGPLYGKIKNDFWDVRDKDINIVGIKGNAKKTLQVRGLK